MIQINDFCQIEWELYKIRAGEGNYDALKKRLYGK